MSFALAIGITLAVYIAVAFLRAVYYHYVTSARLIATNGVSMGGPATKASRPGTGTVGGESPATATRWLEITLEELSKHTGQDGYRPLALSIRGVIYDVSTGIGFYGEGKPYGVYAGREVARALGKMSLKEEDCSANMDDFTEKESATLEQWEAKFSGKYPVLGKVVPSLQLTLEALAGFDGRDEAKPMYLAIRGVVFDVSSATAFYGPDGAYPFAGKEGARALGKYSTDVEDCTSDVEDLNISEMDALRGWEAQFHTKYKVVGRVVG